MTRLQRRVLLRRISRWSIGAMLTCTLVLGVLIAFSDERHPDWQKECHATTSCSPILVGKVWVSSCRTVTTCNYLPLTMRRAFERFAVDR